MEKPDILMNSIKESLNDEVFYYSNTKKKYFVLKRIIDITLSAILIIILIPLFLFLAVIIKTESSGEIIFVQKRTGKNGKPFNIYKFRSMTKDAESKRNSLIKDNKMDGPVFKIVNDPRITKFGKFIRKTSLDELPQLFNIIKGDMSIVGPRPLVTYETKDFNTYQHLRHNVKPGLTCYWQIEGRNEVSFEKWMQLDNQYIKDVSLKTDAIIFIKTIRVVLLGIGAY